MSEITAFASFFVSRRTDFAVQLETGLYARAGRTLLASDIYKHLDGTQTIGSYVMNERGVCSYAVFDADSDDGLDILRGVQARLGRAGITSYLERSRRGGHLWVFLAQPVRASHLRRWLVPYCPTGVEFYPKQDEGNGYGNLIRLPFGVHRRSGKRYPFVTWEQGQPVPVATSVRSSLAWLATIERVGVPPLETIPPLIERRGADHKKKSFSSSPLALPGGAPQTIREWCAQQEPFSLISQYVDLNSQGVGLCPFGWHHHDGHDSHPSFKVYTPRVAGGYCWYCHVWEQGGSVFDFLRYYRNIDARTLWQELKRDGAGLHTTVQVTRGVQNTSGVDSVGRSLGGAK